MKGPVYDKSFNFALMMVDLFRRLKLENEFIISKQLLRSGTSIGANVNEASAAVSRSDFSYKMSTASKEARETKYWLLILQNSNITKINVQKELELCDELIRLLTAIVKSTKKTQN